MMRSFQLLTAAIATATLSFATPRPAVAQFTNPYTFSTWNNPISSSADTAILNRAFQRMVEGGTPGSANVAAVAPVAPAPLSASTFRPVATQLMPQRLAADPALSPAEQREMATLYSDLLTFYHDWLEEEGEQHLRNNVAGAMLYLVQASHYVLNDGEELSLADQEAILQAFNDSLAGDLHFQQLSPQAKQEMYETLVISASLPLALYSEGYEFGDDEVMAQAQEMAEATLIAVLTGAEG